MIIRALWGETYCPVSGSVASITGHGSSNKRTGFIQGYKQVSLQLWTVYLPVILWLFYPLLPIGLLGPGTFELPEADWRAPSCVPPTAQRGFDRCLFQGKDLQHSAPSFSWVSISSDRAQLRWLANWIFSVHSRLRWIQIHGIYEAAWIDVKLVTIIKTLFTDIIAL